MSTHAESVKAALCYIADLIALDNVDPHNVTIAEHAGLGVLPVTFDVQSAKELHLLGRVFRCEPQLVSSGPYLRVWATRHRDPNERFLVDVMWTDASHNAAFESDETLTVPT